MDIKFEKLVFNETTDPRIPVCACILRRDPGEKEFYTEDALGLTRDEVIEIRRWIDEYLGGEK